MTHVGDKVLVLPDGSGGCLVRTGGDPQVASKVVVVPAGKDTVPAVVVSNDAVVGSKVLVKKGDGGQWFVLMAEGGGVGDGDDLPGLEGEPPGSFHLVSIVPADGANDVDPSVTIVLTFSDNVFSPTVLEPTGPYDEDQITLEDSGGVGVGQFPGVAGKVVTLDPVLDLEDGETYTVRIRRYVRNTDNMLLYKAYSKSFTVNLVGEIFPLASMTIYYAPYVVMNPEHTAWWINGIAGLYVQCTSTTPHTKVDVTTVSSDMNDGWMEVFIDGISKGSFNTWNTGNQTYSFTGLANTTHTVKVVCKGINGGGTGSDIHVGPVRFYD